MKALVILGILAATGLAQTPTAVFTNTSFVGPFTVGNKVPLMWTTGNGLPVSLSIANSSWSHKIIAGRAVLPTLYEWTVEGYPGFISGNYQLILEQINGRASNSPLFNVIAPESVNATTIAAPSPSNTGAVTYIYWDHICGCKKTGTAISPMNTGLPVTTTSWWDNHCGCHKSALVPVTTLPPSNNYTVPAAPPVTTAQTTAPVNRPAPSATAGTSAPAAFTGGAVKVGCPVIGTVAIMAVAALI